MNNNQLQSEIDVLKLENNKLQQENVQLKKHLKKYTSPTRAKRYYQNNKEKLMDQNKEYKKKTNYKVDPEKRKEYNKKYYQNKKIKEIEV